jgi:DNA invertase Pin-like site-specific DNA recombinase
MTNVAIYTRLSQDRDGTKTSTQRQEADCRALAQARGWKVGNVYRDNGLSAFNGKDRPAFVEMLSALDAGTYGGILAWKTDRLGRRTADVVALIDRVTGHGGFVATVDGLDSSTNVGKAVMGVAAIFAQLESENTAARVTRAKVQAAREGRPSGGGLRPFGYEPGGMKLRRREADMIRAAASEILAGGSLRGVARDWARQRVKMAPASIRRTLMAPRIAGLRSYKGEVIGDAAWPAIITPAEHEQLAAILGDPGRKTSREGARRYLLTGTARCGQCRDSLVANPSSQTRAYACRSQRRGTGCPGVRIKADALDDFVASAVFRMLDTRRLAKMRRQPKDDAASGYAAELRRDEAALERLTTDHYTEGILGRREFLAAHGKLTKRIEATRRKLADAAGERTVAALPSSGPDLRRLWEAGDITWRRDLVAAVIERVTVGKSRARGQTDLGRVGITWRVDV